MTKLAKIIRKALPAAMVTATMLGASPAFAGVDVNTTNGLTSAGPGLALHGYDAVAYFTEKKPLRGQAMYSATHRDATYRFASKANLETFQANPQKYVPQYGGFCAYGVSVGAKFDGDPTLWKVVDGKLYLNLNPEIQKKWEKDISGSIVKADQKWTVIKDKTSAELK